MEVLPVLPNEAHAMADTPYITSDGEDIDSVEINVESSVQNDDIIVSKKNCKDMNELHAEHSHASKATTQATYNVINFI